MRNPETQAPINEDTIYRIYSMTKPITGVAMMMLYEEGKFSLDDPVSKYVPEFENLKVLGPKDDAGKYPIVALERQPTMRELMSHTAGLRMVLAVMIRRIQPFASNASLAPGYADIYRQGGECAIAVSAGNGMVL